MSEVGNRNGQVSKAAKTSRPIALPLSHLLVGVLVMAIWGSNFVVIRQGLRAFPPFLFGALRFAFVFFPAALLIKRPAVSCSLLALYGIAAGGGQFGLLYLALDGYISPGLASLVIQSQVFFTVAIAIVAGEEKIRAKHAVSAMLALSGLAVIAIKAGGDASVAGLIMVIGAALAWAVANTVLRRAPPGTMLPFIIWSSPFALLPLLALSILAEGPGKDIAAVTAASAGEWLAVLWQSTGNTLFGFAIWGWLLQRHRASTVTPLALLVPVFGIGSSAMLLGEPLQLWKVVAALFVLAGLSVNLISWRQEPRGGKAEL